MKTNKVKLLDMELNKYVKAIKERYGDEKSFLQKFAPCMQNKYSDFEEIVANKAELPLVENLVIAYGSSIVICCVLAQVDDLNNFGDCHLSKKQMNDIAYIIFKESRPLPISAILNFFYRLKSGEYVTSGQVSPLMVTCYLRQFLSQYNAAFWFLCSKGQENPNIKEKDVEAIVKKGCFKVIGFWIEPTDRPRDISRALRFVSGVKGVVLAKSGFVEINDDKFNKYSEAVTFDDMTRRDIKAGDIQTLYLVKM